MDVQDIFRDAHSISNLTFGGSRRICILVTPDEWDALVLYDQKLQFRHNYVEPGENYVKLYAHGIEIRKKYEREKPPKFQPNDYLVMSGG